MREKNIPTQILHKIMHDVIFVPGVQQTTYLPAIRLHAFFRFQKQLLSEFYLRCDFQTKIKIDLRQKSNYLRK